MPAYSRILLPWDSQPQEPVGINGDSPYAQNLVTCIPLHPQWGMRNLVTGAAVTKTGLAGTVVGPHGLYPSFGTSNYCDFDNPAQITSDTTPITIAWDQYPVATSAYSTVLNWKPNGATHAFAIYQSAAVAGYYFVVGKRSGAAAILYGGIGAVTNNILDRYVLVCRAGTSSLTAADFSLYRNGILQTATGSASLGANSVASSRLGALDSAGDVFEGAIGNFCIWNEAFSDAKAAAYDLQRWQLFAPRSIPVPVSSASSGTSFTITPSGGITFGGTSVDIKGKILEVSGGVTFSGTGNATFASGGTTYTITPSGGLVFAGSGVSVNSKVFLPSGGITFAGSGLDLRTKVIDIGGGVSFGGTGSMSSNTSTGPVQSGERTKVGVGT